MTDNHKYKLKILMQKYLDRTCSVEERNELVELISKTSGAVEVDDLWREVWAETDGSDRMNDLSWETLQNLKQTGKESHLSVVWKKVWKWSAAAAIVLICFYFATDWMGNGDNMMVYETGYGERLEIFLEDGTKVNLNADSKLSWEKNWEENGLRQVHLEGEAYFDVSHLDQEGLLNQMHTGSEPVNESQMPFEVLTSDMTIRVLGTAFNASQRRGKTEVFLERGLVELALHRQDERNVEKVSRDKEDKKHNHESDMEGLSVTIPKKIIQMNPGDWISYSSGRDILEQKTMVEPEDKTEWKDGILSYQDVEFHDMLQNLEDLYGKKFDVQDQELLSKRVNFSLPYKDWDTVQEMMKWMLGVEVIKLDDDRVLIK